MLPCAPYIKNMCQTIPFSKEEGFSPEQSPKHKSVIKKQTEVKVTDVKSVKVDLLDTSDDVITYDIGENIQVVAADVTKVLTTFKPESPDVTRAAKKFEKAKKTTSSDDKSEESYVTNCDATDDTEVRQREQEKLGAISKGNNR